MTSNAQYSRPDPAFDPQQPGSPVGRPAAPDAYSRLETAAAGSSLNHDNDNDNGYGFDFSITAFADADEAGESNPIADLQDDIDKEVRASLVACWFAMPRELDDLEEV